MMVLAALTIAPVSYVAPVREVSILIGAFMGARLLGEADAGRRLLGAAAIVAGVFALALGLTSVAGARHSAVTALRYTPRHGRASY